MRARLRTLASTLGLIEDSPHRIALGLAIGLWLAWTPTVGLQTVLVLPIVWAMRANALAAVIGIHLSNPITFFPMYWVEYELGEMFLRDAPSLSDFVQEGESGGAMEMTAMGWQMWLTMWIGGIILGFLTAIPGYFGARWFLTRARARRTVANLAVEPGS